MSRLALELGDELLEALAVRVAELLAERDHVDAGDVVSRIDNAATQNGAGYLDVAAAAEFLACGASRIYALVSAKRLPVHRDGSRLLFDRQELRAYVNQGGAKRP